MLTTAEIDSLPSRQFGGYDWSENVLVNQTIEIFFEDYMTWARDIDGQKRIKQQDEIRIHLKCLVLELYRTYKINPELALAISLGNETISNYQHDRYKPSHISFRLVNHVFNFLFDKGYIEFPFGEKGRATGAITHQRSTRIRATYDLIDVMDFIGINKYMICPNLNAQECIQLRKRKQRGQIRGDNEQYSDTEFTLQARENLTRINAFIARHHIDLKISDADEHELAKRINKRFEGDKPNYLDYTQNWLRRIFNNSSFENGGRFYGGLWQLIPKEFRFLITIDGDNTREYDFSGMHFAMLYAMSGLDFPEGDVYELVGYDKSLRAGIKEAFNIIVNCQTVAQAIGTINEKIKNGELNPGLKDGKSLIEAFKTRHKPIAEFIASGEGVRLQFMDSQIAESIMLQGVQNKICILPIHDGFITKEKHEQALTEFMQNAFNSIMGSKITIKPEPIDPNLIDDSQKGFEAHITTSDGELISLEGHEDREASGFGSVVGVEHITSEIKAFTNYYRREREWAEAALP